MTTGSNTLARPDAALPPLPRSLGWALGSGTILQGLNSAVVAVALIPIAVHFGSSAAIPWIVSGLYIAAAVGSPTGGKFADLFGARRVYLAGLVIALAASLAGPFMPSVEALVIDRVVLGLGTSLQFPAAMAIIRRAAARTERSPVGAIGVVALCGQTMAALGPTIGGLLVVAFGWQGIFWVNLPIVLNAVIWVLVAVPKDEERPRMRVLTAVRAIDPLGLVLFVAALVLLMTGLLSLEGDPLWLLFAAAAPLAGLFVWRELRAATPFVDVRLMVRHRQLGITCLRAVVTFVSFYCIFYGLPQWLEESRGLDAAVTGLLMFPVFAVGVVSTILATRMGRRLAPRTLLLIGTAAMVVGGGVLAVAVDTASPLWLLAVASGLLGVPNGFNNLGNQLILHSAVPESSAGSASGVYRTSQYLGAALSAVIVAHSVGTEFDAGGIRSLGAWIGGIGLVLLILNIIAIVRGHRAGSGGTP
ncbi:MFS transporter [Rathayibacter sp. ZW T2_19]|uniref:MFS transporter n=1 Tax=Rathayibacter rubneri TaxID=2950106 RepID=A0A9X2DZF0_9MICO|nr:MFS transporter [Rathayibacter rubneri]MCM6764042.1 MFS transporter [Rathayibacter rubneri]